MIDLTLNPLGWREAPFVEQWLGIWAMREPEFAATAEIVRGLNVSLHLHSQAALDVQAAAADGGTSSYLRDGAVAIIEMRGRMQKQQASLGQNTSTVATRRAIRAAANDPEVGAILMVVDSPGGTVAGTKELADDIAAASQVKPVIGFAEDIAASAAYWALSQATEVIAQATATIGSIGTYGVVQDLSALAAKEGIKVHVVRAGAMKGAGTPGTEVTADQLAEFQAEVNALNEFFLAGVAAGREMSIDQVRELATGQIWIGQQAVGAGLIDAVATYDQAVARARAAAATRMKGKKMAAATYAEIVAACPGATPEFICEQLKAGATVEGSVKDFIAHQQLQLEAAKKENADLQAKAKAEAEAAAAAVKAKTIGVEPLKTTTAGGAGSAIANAAEEFQAAVEAKVKAGLPRPRAVAEAVRENPARHKAFLEEAAASAASRKRG